MSGHSPTDEQYKTFNRSGTLQTEQYTLTPLQTPGFPEHSEHQNVAKTIAAISSRVSWWDHARLAKNFKVAHFTSSRVFV